MGVFTDWLDNQLVLGERPYVAERRVAYNEIQWHIRREDPEIHHDLIGQTAIHIIQQVAHPFSKYQLTFTWPDGLQVTTGDIAAGATGATWDLAIHTACNGVVPGWTYQDIRWQQGSLIFSTPLVWTYTGDTVNFRAMQVTGEYTYFYSGDIPIVTIREGYGPQHTWGVIYELGLYGPATHDPGDDLPEDAELLKRPDETIRWPSASLRAKLAQQAAIDDGYPPMEQQLRNLFNIG